jgi:hypothetical protein
MRIIVRQVSGLGNQLFQYAAGQYYARRCNASMEVAIEPTAQQDSFGYPRPFLLSHFCVERPLRNTSTFDGKIFAHRPGLKQAAGLLRSALGIELFTEPIERRYTFIENLPLGSNVRTLYLSGYWQAAGLVQAVADKLRVEFRLKAAPAGKNLEVIEQIGVSRSPVSLHIRRGDYALVGAAIGPLGMDYYARAISMMREKLSDPTFFVFSDDMEFARKSLPAGLRAVFVDHNDSFSSHEDLRLMAACSHHVIANSSFSWWGAWLNPSSSKIVIAPRNWLGRPGSYYPELLPPEWTIID